MPIIILMDEAQETTQALQARFPEERFLAVDTPDGLDAALAEAPDIGFSINSRKVPGPNHRRLINTPGLRWMQVGGSGYEHLGQIPDGLAVTNCAGVLAPFLAETTIGALLSLNCGLVRYQDASRQRVWKGYTFRPLAGQTLAVVGAGAIGQEVARRAGALCMRAIGLNRSGTATAAFDEMRPLSTLDDTLGEADAVSVHLRLTTETAGLFNADRFARMRPGALFLNSARGRIAVERDLIEALEKGHVGGAWLDVFEVEPLPVDSPLWTMPNVLVTPHASDQVVDWQERFAEFFAENLSRWRRGEPLVNRVAGPEQSVAQP